MASEITTAITHTVQKNGVSVSNSMSKSIDMAGTEMLSSVQVFTTTTAQISIGGCDSVGCITIKNLDTTNSLRVGLDNADPITQLISSIPPGAAIQLHNPPATLYAESTAGTVEAFVVVNEA